MCMNPNIDKDIWEWLDQDKTIPYLQLDINDIPYKEIYKEALAVKGQAIPHRDYGQGGGWSSLCLHGISSTKTNAWEQYEENKGLTEDQIDYKWTDIADQCPITTEYFKNKFPYRQYKRLRFMWLEPGGKISLHRDSKQRTFSPVNIAINNPDGCDFNFKNKGTVPFKPGIAFLIDVGQHHEVINNSNEVRLHIIAHGKRHYKEWIDILESSWEKFGYEN